LQTIDTIGYIDPTLTTTKKKNDDGDSSNGDNDNDNKNDDNTPKVKRPIIRLRNKIRYKGTL